MSSKINAVRGMRDILPEEISYWHYIEAELQKLTSTYGYKEIRLPIVESTDLFKRSVGQVTDIVEKEMYTFTDRNGDSLTLRPEGTAGVVRAGIEHSLFYGNTPKVWYLGPMYRHERPQKGRYRQFYQFGLEAFGVSSPYLDAEVILFCNRLWKNLGLENKVKLQINCLGTPEVRQNYKKDLVKYFTLHMDQLDEDSKNRLERNPLRILDSKNPQLKDVISSAPKLSEYLDDVSNQHMQTLYGILDSAGVEYTVNPHLVRGLDYYCLTVFEWVTDELGAQGTVCAGGRYDNLVEEIGGQPTSAIGMSLGMERLVILLQEHGLDIKPEAADVYLALLGENALANGGVIAERIIDELSGVKINVNYSGQSFKNQLKKADKSGAKVAIILGDDEISNNLFTVKYLRERKEQQQIDFDGLIEILKGI